MNVSLESVKNATQKHSREVFDGAREPEFTPNRFTRWGGRLVYAIAYERFKLRTWRAFRDHTGHWPVFSITFHYLKTVSALAGCLFFGWNIYEGNWSGLRLWIGFAVIFALYVLATELGTAASRKLDWKLFGGRKML